MEDYGVWYVTVRQGHGRYPPETVASFCVSWGSSEQAHAPLSSWGPGTFSRTGRVVTVGIARIAVLAALLVSACGGAAAPAARTKDPLGGRYTVSGGGGALEPVNALTQAFQRLHPLITWVIEDVGSDGGIQLAANGGADLGMISRDLRDAEKGTVRTLSIGLSGTGMAVNPANPVTGLTKDQVSAIYTGKVSDWSQVGGASGKMTVLVREAGSATRSAFESYFFTGKPTYGKDVIEVYELQETLKAISSFKDSIGMLSITNATLANATIKFLSIDGVAVSKETIANGSYKIRRPLYLVYNNDPTNLKPAIAAFLDFVRGPEGQKIIAGL